MRRLGIAKSPLDEKGISISNTNGVWKAAAKDYTKREAFKNRLRESLGEGLEEYNQDLSGAFGQGFATDKMKQYMDNKYNLNKDGSKALSNDVVSNITSGLHSLGQELTSQEAIKDGLYGGLSTFMGGINANAHVLNGSRGTSKRLPGESTFDYIKRRNLVGWRSGITPLFTNTESDVVNKQRQELADRVNNFFSNTDTQNAFFNLASTSNWMKQQQDATNKGDEKESS